MGPLTNERTIGGLHVTVEQFPADEAFPLGVRLLQIAAPILPDIVEILIMGGGPDAKVDLSRVTEVLTTLVAQAQPDEFMKLVKQLTAMTMVIDREAKPEPLKYELSNATEFNDAFAGRLAAMLQVVAFAAEVNYKDFFSAALRSAAVTKSTPDESKTANPSG